MRVIAGLWRGHPLQSPPGDFARPTTDRVKESMFHLLGPSSPQDTVLDLFAGSGALGIEALSRGAPEAIFADVHPASLSVVRTNLARLRAEQSVQIWKSDWQKTLQRVLQEERKLSWIFVDPPYAKGLWLPILEWVASHPLHFAKMILESPKQVQLPEQIGRIEMKKNRVYGDIAVTVYEPVAIEEMG